MLKVFLTPKFGDIFPRSTSDKSRAERRKCRVKQLVEAPCFRNENEFTASEALSFFLYATYLLTCDVVKLLKEFLG